MTAIYNLQPKEVWQYFYEITRIARPSKHEEAIINYLIEFSNSLNLSYKKDEVGNLVIYKPAQKSAVTRPIILQSHVDMVCEKEEWSTINFATDPIEAYVDGNMVKARGTTLGADCGIGMAIEMAVLASKTISHPPIEALFTVDEESGLTGAFGLSADMLTGKTLINLDSEDEQEIFIGCAGGRDTVATFCTKYVSIDGRKLLRLTIDGLQGGHSGDNINQGLANSIIVLSRFIKYATEELGCLLVDISGGNLRNAIPRRAEVVLALSTNSEKLQESIITEWQKFGKTIQKEYHHTEPNIAFEIVEEAAKEHMSGAFSPCLTTSIINSIFCVQNGVIAYSQDIEGFVESSSNLASVRTYSDRVEIVSSCRSSVESKREYLSKVMTTHYSSYGATVWQSGGYPGWEPSPKSYVVELFKEAYTHCYGNLPKVKAIHAGLECGLFLTKYPLLDMVSVGPDIKLAHSPSERLKIESVSKFWDVMVYALEHISTEEK